MRESWIFEKMPIGVYPSPEQLNNGRTPSPPKDLWTKVKEDPLTPIGVLITASIICMGVANIATGNVSRSQKLMRARVLAQGE